MYYLLPCVLVNNLAVIINEAGTLKGNVDQLEIITGRGSIEVIFSFKIMYASLNIL